jgi:hypothetical protein
MSVNINMITMPNIKVNWYNQRANNRLHKHLYFNAARLKIYVYHHILVIQFAKSQLVYVYANSEKTFLKGFDGRRKGP